MPSTNPRPWRNHNHLADTIEVGANGAINVQPIRADDIHFDIGWASNGAPIEIGRGIEICATGNVKRVDGVWVMSRDLHGRQSNDRELTRQQRERASALIAELIGQWAATHEGDIAQADDIDRNNAAHRLERAIAEHEGALEILRANLAACEEGEPFQIYPDLPTER